MLIRMDWLMLWISPVPRIWWSYRNIRVVIRSLWRLLIRRCISVICLIRIWSLSMIPKCGLILISCWRGGGRVWRRVRLPLRAVVCRVWRMGYILWYWIAWLPRPGSPKLSYCTSGTSEIVRSSSKQMINNYDLYLFIIFSIIFFPFQMESPPILITRSSDNQRRMSSTSQLFTRLDKTPTSR